MVTTGLARRYVGHCPKRYRIHRGKTMGGAARVCGESKSEHPF